MTTLPVPVNARAPGHGPAFALEGRRGGMARLAQDRPPANLKDLPTGQQVTGVGYCRGQYDVTLGDGSARTFKEYDLAFKIDSSANGPRPAHPALVPTGRVGDRAFVVFADLDELRGTVKAACRD